MRTVKIDYQPTPKQAMFHASTANEILYGGAAGGGKTCALIMDALMRCLAHPRTHAYVFRRTFRELEDTDIREARSRYPKEIATYNVSRHEFQLLNGSVIKFRHCEHESDKYDYSGAEIDWLYFDELTAFEKSVVSFIKTRLRSKAASGVTPLVRSASNPGNIGHAWVKEEYVDIGLYMQIHYKEIYSEVLREYKTVSIQYIPALATENPHITKDYIFELEQKPDKLRRALLNGDWDAFEGQVFTEFINLWDRRLSWSDLDKQNYAQRKWTHVIEPFEIPMSWPRYMSFDHGYSSPFSIGWWAVDPKGRVYRYREWYGTKKTPRELAEGILEREQQEIMENIHVYRIADPSIGDKSRGESVEIQMQPNSDMGLKGVYFDMGNNDRLAGKMQVHEWLRFDSEGKPMLYCFRTCTDWIRTVPSLPYSGTKVEDVDTDAEDHCVIGDTKVLTDKGWLTIRDLSDTIGYVVSHDGKLHKYSDCRKTQEQVDVYTVTMDDGRSVTATPNHRFMMKDGTWKRLDELSIGDEMMEVNHASISFIPDATRV